MRILVTGGAGFIGSNFIHHMLARHSDVEIVNLDLLTYSGRMENLQDIHDDKRYKFVKGDIRDEKLVEQQAKNHVDAIVNFAAESHVDRSITAADAFVSTNVYGTCVLLETARKHDIGKFVQISTDEVYGSIEKGSFTETDPLNPSSPYSASKAAADLLSLAYHKTYGLNVVITRSTNNFGPRQHPEKLIPKLIIRALHDQVLPIYGTGRQVRDWIYTEENCKAIELVLQKGKAGEIYNIASGKELTNLEIAKLLLKLLKKPEKLIKFVADRPGHDYRYSLETSKIKGLGWRHNGSFEKHLQSTVDWYVSNEWWWQPLTKDKFFQTNTPWMQP
ncbi:MAG: dTDP-glucose 4,6-dehydratase [Candidatus Bathyarchaeia archaeon]|jgi:dTDP-glucose 4,6-dehydratase|nr:dTDP-glucose 4,6-dehydratase [Candidatus Bathyarchaeota archaeon A05DMB-4]MDH7595130.1 dTDP-glucose 4,6-dehydratase [Candidatus Bathyarchaeota archaeon]